MTQTSNSVPPIVVFDIDGVVRDVGGSYRRAIADTVEHFTNNAYRPTVEDLDRLKSEGIWNNDWEASQELVYRYFEAQGRQRTDISLNYDTMVDFFQSRYRGANWDGYICSEPLLLQPSYLEHLTNAGIPWGFFSGAPRDEAMYVLSRLGLNSPVLVAMEDAPGKPDPTGLFATVRQLAEGSAVIGVAQSRDDSCGVGILPAPVIQGTGETPIPPHPGTGETPIPPHPGTGETPIPPHPGTGETPIPQKDQNHPVSMQRPVIYVGDTVADMYVVEKARHLQDNRTWIAVGILPPHVLETPLRLDAYTATLQQAGAAIVLGNVEELTPARIYGLLNLDL
ncbi:TIGR01548 family HAD-type hydrolase [Microseira wollei]|uniref:HAD family hydrolase n=1 Tax=Microseira wollei NIES-4236 TaxID=2530354 RepID=A0AAV3XBZ2_9CYAN|nr:TIGR01548 family HAD-type hydrolase [Microseira wollei]GET38295.1 HAD family hydrolase [Microseira wollei NIES-4236]